MSTDRRTSGAAWLRALSHRHVFHADEKIALREIADLIEAQPLLTMYAISRTDPGYDEYAGSVLVAAATEDEARSLIFESPSMSPHHSECVGPDGTQWSFDVPGAEYRHEWLDQKKTRVTLLGHCDGEPRILTDVFNAG